MNNVAIFRQNTVCQLEIHELARPYRDADSLQNSTQLHQFESPSGFGAFQVGETLSQSNPTKYLGTIQHIHHWLGEDEDGRLVHRTLLYVSNSTERR